MKRAATWGLGVLAGAAVTVAVAVVLGHVRVSGSSLLIVADPTAVRPRARCILNPLRDREPERVAERILDRLSKGQLDGLSTLLPEIVREREQRYPVTSWRVGRRNDKSAQVTVMYWVTRGGGYRTEEEVTFSLRKATKGWIPTAYDAIY